MVQLDGFKRRWILFAISIHKVPGVVETPSSSSASPPHCGLHGTRFLCYYWLMLISSMSASSHVYAEVPFSSTPALVKPCMFKRKSICPLLIDKTLYLLIVCNSYTKSVSPII